ncbi:SpoIID/LytB domain-containing protein [Thermodesulfobium sp. 4217-1]|uniref:SpoIID/LytB domain-containing protein n=1 Tax=Thermodesulfobium sp. 4217-1 TaxID=3120013 RepID=UPI003221A2B0
MINIRSILFLVFILSFFATNSDAYTVPVLISTAKVFHISSQSEIVLRKDKQPYKTSRIFVFSSFSDNNSGHIYVFENDTFEVSSKDPINIDGLEVNSNLMIGEKNGFLNAFVLIDLESYVKKVVSCEMPSSWPIQALEAQAILARTYALKKIKENGYILPNSLNQNFDIRSLVPKNIEEAVDKTNGEIISYKGSIASVFYHSSSGMGMTENVENVWGSQIPYLIPVRDYDKFSPYVHWIKKIPLDKVFETLKNEKFIQDSSNDYKFNGVKIISIDSSGRAEKVEFTINKKKYIVTSLQLRKIFGLYSTNFRVTIDERFLSFEGSGSGHGVGLSQWGAYAMAKSNISYKNIIKHYFPGTEVTKFDP